jgi:hypothetical protein
MDIERIDGFVKAVHKYGEIMGVRVRAWKTTDRTGPALSATVEKALDAPVAFRAVLARKLGLRLYPGDAYDLLTLRDTVVSGPLAGGGVNAADSRPAAVAHAPTEPRGPRPPAAA